MPHDFRPPHSGGGDELEIGFVFDARPLHGIGEDTAQYGVQAPMALLGERLFASIRMTSRSSA